jgi:NitT/TauT family transport system substrate-binding protein
MHNIFGIFLLVATFLLCGCGDTPKKPALRIGVIEWTGFYGLMRGHVDGAFASAGLSVEVIGYPDNPTINADLAAGRLDVGGMVWADLIRLSAHGQDLRAITVLDWSDSGDVLLASPSIAAPADLRGKRIAFEGVHSFSHLFVLGILAKHSLSETDVSLVDLAAQQVPAALKDGRIDAGHTWGPLAEAAAKDGFTVIDRAGAVPGWITEVLGARVKVLKERRDELKLLLSVLDRLHPADPKDTTGREAARVAAGRFLNKPAADLAPIDREAHLVSAKDALLLLTDAKDPHGLRTSGSRIISFFAQRGQVPKDHDVTALIDASLLSP